MHALPASSGRCYHDIDASFIVLLAEVCINVVPLCVYPNLLGCAWFSSTYISWQCRVLLFMIIFIVNTIIILIYTHIYTSIVEELLGCHC